MEDDLRKRKAKNTKPSDAWMATQQQRFRI